MNDRSKTEVTHRILRRYLDNCGSAAGPRAKNLITHSQRVRRWGRSVDSFFKFGRPPSVGRQASHTGKHAVLRLPAGSVARLVAPVRRSMSDVMDDFSHDLARADGAQPALELDVQLQWLQSHPEEQVCLLRAAVRLRGSYRMYLMRCRDRVSPVAPSLLSRPASLVLSPSPPPPLSPPCATIAAVSIAITSACRRSRRPVRPQRSRRPRSRSRARSRSTCQWCPSRAVRASRTPDPCFFAPPSSLQHHAGGLARGTRTLHTFSRARTHFTRAHDHAHARPHAPSELPPPIHALTRRTRPLALWTCPLRVHQRWQSMRLAGVASARHQSHPTRLEVGASMSEVENGAAVLVQRQNSCVPR